MDTHSDTDGEIIVPEENHDTFAFPCPDCGTEIRPPMGGHRWTCSEAYGGCGAAFKPIRAFRRVDDEEGEA